MAHTPTLSIVGPQHEVPETVDTLLAEILQWPRCHTSPAELRFRAWLGAHINSFSGDANRVQYLAEGCLYVSVPTAMGKQASTLFSCHIDTCDTMPDGNLTKTDDGRMVVPKKEVMYDSNFGSVFLATDGKIGSCLGADDGVGVWFMLRMLEAKVPGGYIFHTGEERGGVGSYAVLGKNKDILKKYEVAVAFDRPRNNEVITHQGRLRCASDAAGNKLAELLNAHGFDYKLSTGGTFTDTKVYRGVIAECFNLGVGYEKQHGRGETLDYAHAAALLKALLTIDWTSIPVSRDPTAPDPAAHKAYDWRANKNYGYQGSFLGDEDVWNTPPSKAKGKPKAKAKELEYTELASAYDDLVQHMSHDDLIATCEMDPDAMVDTVTDLLVEIARLRAEVMVLRKIKR